MQEITIVPHYNTEEELWSLSHEGGRYEIWNGELKCLAPTEVEHGRLIAELSAEVGLFVRRHKLGQCFAAYTGFRISENPLTILAPDFAFIRRYKLPEIIPAKFLPVVPDIVLEVRSPGDRASEVADKVARWLAAGTQIVWELNPRTKTLTIFQPDVAAIELDQTSTLRADSLLPGWSLDLGTIF